MGVALALDLFPVVEHLAELFAGTVDKGLFFGRQARWLGGKQLAPARRAGEELTVRVVPKQVDEFTCNSCFLVRHRSQLANEKKMICRECAQ